jgi:hypothetical protein
MVQALHRGSARCDLRHNISWIARFDVLGVEPFLHGHVFALDDWLAAPMEAP